MFRSASCSGTSRPHSVTWVPNGITANARNPGNIARIGRDRVDGAIRVGRRDAFLEEELDAVGERDQHAARAGAHRADPRLEVGDHLALHPDVEHHGDQQREEHDHDLHDAGSPSRPSPSGVTPHRSGHRLGELAALGDRAGSTSPARANICPDSNVFAASPGWLNGTNAAPAATCSVDARPAAPPPGVGAHDRPAAVGEPSGRCVGRVHLDERLVLERRLQLVGALGQTPLVDEQRIREQLACPPRAGSAVAAAGSPAARRRRRSAPPRAAPAAGPSPRGARRASRSRGRRRTPAPGSRRSPSRGG